MCILNKSNKSIILQMQHHSEYPFLMSLGIAESYVITGGDHHSVFIVAGGGGILESLTAAKQALTCALK